MSSHKKKDPFMSPKAPKAPHAPKAPKAPAHVRAPRMTTRQPQLLHSRNIAGTTPRHHAAAVSRAMKTTRSPGANAGPSGVPIGNPAPSAANAFE